MSVERIFRDEESLTPDAIAADRKTASLTEIPPFVYALGAVLSRFNNGIN